MIINYLLQRDDLSFIINSPTALKHISASTEDCGCVHNNDNNNENNNNDNRRLLVGMKIELAFGWEKVSVVSKSKKLLGFLVECHFFK